GRISPPPPPSRTIAAAAVCLRIAAQSRPADLDLDLVEGRRGSCRTGWATAVHYAHTTSLAAHRPCPRRHGYARHRGVRGAPEYPDNAHLYPLEWPAAGGQVRPRHATHRSLACATR